MKKSLLFASILFSLLLALPIFQMATGLLQTSPLVGMEPTARLPDWGVASWWKGDLQAEFDVWFSQNIGSRALLVRTANQINFKLFRELPARGDTSIVWMGKEGFLFLKDAVDAYNGFWSPIDSRTPAASKLEEEMQTKSAAVRRLQDRLAADGIAFLLVIAPSKAETYPEYLPAVADVAGRSLRRTNYDPMIELLRRDGVNLLDGHALFLEWKSDSGTPLLFTKGGSHWNDYGATRMLAEILECLRELTGMDLPALHVVGAVTNDVVFHADNDLGRLVNLWTGAALAGPQIHPLLEVRMGSHMPDILLVGDSFVHTLTYIMDVHKLYRQMNFYYYYNREHSFPDNGNALLDRKQIKLLDKVRHRDAVLIEICEIFLPKIGYGFVEGLLDAYDARDAQVKLTSAEEPSEASTPSSISDSDENEPNEVLRHNKPEEAL